MLNMSHHHFQQNLVLLGFMFAGLSRVACYPSNRSSFSSFHQLQDAIDHNFYRASSHTLLQKILSDLRSSELPTNSFQNSQTKPDLGFGRSTSGSKLGFFGDAMEKSKSAAGPGKKRKRSLPMHIEAAV